MRLPLLSGFFATHLPSPLRPVHTIHFRSPINENPISLSVVEACSRETNAELIETGHQKQAVIVVDEQIYHNYVKTLRNNPVEFERLFVYPGDFHLTKTTMIVTWQLLEGSGVEDLHIPLYKGATLRSIFNVHHFNKSLRSCKLLHSSPWILLVEAYATSVTASTTSSSNDTLDKCTALLKNMSKRNRNNPEKQQWFNELISSLKEQDSLRKLTTWAEDMSTRSRSFRYWYLTLRSLLEPLMTLLLYSNAQLQAKKYKALDQSIEYSINKHGKGHGSISGKLSDDSIDRFVVSKHLRTTWIHTIECSPSRLAVDDHDLTLMINKLKQEDIFSISQLEFRKLISGKIVHADIIGSLCSSFKRGERAMSVYVGERLVKKTLGIDEPLKAMPFVKLIDADSYVSGDIKNQRKQRSADVKSRDLSKIMHSIDRQMRNLLIIVEQRRLPPTLIFSHEFTQTPLVFCNISNCSLMNPTKKSIYKWMVIDGVGFIQIKPAAKSLTARQYSDQLFKMVILYNFHKYDHIHVVFDSNQKDPGKAFISPQTF